ncbi:hypothetical protein [Gayadomonas joobiniege]|uniref:hypothetical protein n=1 Tax=Gayadomonas joobiniege TaxID=1234606 RepID=UPI000365B340|nr:hypothetical protein [Gayadomonas joobiniege]
MVNKIFFIGLGITILCLSACSKITPDNYAKLEVGMKFAQIVAILGEPVQCSALDQGRFCYWGDQGTHIKVAFVGDRATLTSQNGLK